MMRNRRYVDNIVPDTIDKTIGEARDNPLSETGSQRRARLGMKSDLGYCFFNTIKKTLTQAFPTRLIEINRSSQLRSGGAVENQSAHV